MFAIDVNCYNMYDSSAVIPASTFCLKNTAPVVFRIYRTFDNSFTHQLALKNNSLRQGILMSVNGLKKLPE
jgi:hypothetical protein